MSRISAVLFDSQPVVLSPTNVKDAKTEQSNIEDIADADMINLKVEQ